MDQQLPTRWERLPRGRLMQLLESIDIGETGIVTVSAWWNNAWWNNAWCETTLSELSVSRTTACPLSNVSIPVERTAGSTPASMLATVTLANTVFMPSELMGQQWDKI